MAYDEDAVLEAMARLKPTIDDLKARISALEALGGGSTMIEVTEYVAKLADGNTRTYRLV